MISLSQLLPELKLFALTVVADAVLCMIPLEHLDWTSDSGMAPLEHCGWTFGSFVDLDWSTVPTGCVDLLDCLGEGFDRFFFLSEGSMKEIVSLQRSLAIIESPRFWL